MANQVLEAFIKLFADDTRLKQQMGALKAEAEKAGADVSRAFEGGTARGAPGRAPGGAKGLAERFGIGGLGQAARTAGAGRLGGLASLAGRDPRLAAAAGGALIAANYVRQVKAATEAEQELARARESGDPAAVNALLTKRTTALKELEDTAREAIQPVTGLESAVRKALGTFALAWETIAGPGMAARRKQVEDATKAATEMWEAFGAPQLAVEGMKRANAELKAAGEAAVKAAEDTMSYSAAIDMLIKAKQAEAEATRKSIDAELQALIARKDISDAEKAARIKDNQERRKQVDVTLGRDLKAINDDRRKQMGEMEALEIEHTQKLVSLAQQRHDAIVQTLGQIVEIESATTLSLEETYRARFALQAESTQNAIDALEKETAARRKALEARLGGAQGQERVKLERQLTQLTEEQEGKRTEIEGRNIADRLRLFRQAQQEKIGLQERVFGIERMLGERSLHDDLARQSAIAAGARAGSQTQLRALEAVAQSVKALSDQAKQFVGEALAAQDAVARKAGAAAPEFVSRESLAQAAAQRLTQLEEAQRTFTMGGQIGREEAQALAGGELGRLQQQKAAGQREIAGVLGRGPGFGPALGATADPATAFAEQINLAFEKPIDTFTTQVGPAFASMVSKANPQFQEMTDLWSKAVDAMVKKAEDGSSKMGAALYENFKTRLVRDLEREVKTF